MYRDVARAESVKELILKNVAPYNPDNFLNVVQYEDSGHDVIVCLSDLHAGAGIDSAWNKFNKDILKARLESYAAQVFNIVARHTAEKIHVLLLGDLINGHIHVNTRVQNNENSIEQVMTAAELVSNFVATLYEVCQHIDVYSVSGNHSRVFPNKEDQVAGDELEALIPFYMKARLQNLAGIDIKTEKLDPTFGGFIESGCVCGSDSYAIGLRKNDVPQQAVAVIDDSGLECLYDVKLEKPAKIVI